MAQIVRISSVPVFDLCLKLDSVDVYLATTIERTIMLSSKTTPLPLLDRILCYYTNPTKHLQIVRSFDSSGEKLEQVVFPKQRILFEVLPDALISIYTYSKTEGVTLLDEIPCQKLQVRSGSRRD